MENLRAERACPEVLQLSNGEPLGATFKKRTTKKLDPAHIGAGTIGIRLADGSTFYKAPLDADLYT